MSGLAAEMSALIAKYNSPAQTQLVAQPSAQPDIVAPKPVKPKRAMSEKQLEALARGRETRIANALAKKTAKTSTPALPNDDLY